MLKMGASARSGLAVEIAVVTAADRNGKRRCSGLTDVGEKQISLLRSSR
jgi:hypothetical protein